MLKELIERGVRPAPALLVAVARESLTLRLARDLLRKCPTGGSELVLAAAVSSFERSERWREAVELTTEPWIQSI